MCRRYSTVKDGGVERERETERETERARETWGEKNMVKRERERER
jgi:hypothetical protein